MFGQLKNAQSAPTLKSLAAKNFNSFKSLLSEMVAVEDIHSAIFDQNVQTTTAHPSLIVEDSGTSYVWYDFDPQWRSNQKLGRKHAHQVLKYHTLFVNYLRSFLIQHPNDIDGVIEIALEGSSCTYRPIRHLCTLIGMQLILIYMNTNRSIDMLVNHIFKQRLTDTDLSIQIMAMLHFSHLARADPVYTSNDCNDVFIMLSKWMTCSQLSLKMCSFSVLSHLIKLQDSELESRLNEVIERNICSLVLNLQLESAQSLFLYAMNQKIIHHSLLAHVAFQSLENSSLFTNIAKYLGFYLKCHDDSDLMHLTAICKFFVFIQFHLQKNPLGTDLFDHSLFINQFLFQFDHFIAKYCPNKPLMTSSSFLNFLPISNIPNHLTLNDHDIFITHLPLPLIYRAILVSPTIHHNLATFHLPSSYIFEPIIVHQQSINLDSNIIPEDQNVDPNTPNGYLSYLSFCQFDSLTKLQINQQIDFLDPNDSCSHFLYPISAMPLEDFNSPLFKNSLFYAVQSNQDVMDPLLKILGAEEDLFYIAALCCALVTHSIPPLDHVLQSHICYVLVQNCSTVTTCYSASLILYTLFSFNILDNSNLFIVQQAVLALFKHIPDGHTNSVFDYTVVLPTYQSSMAYLALDLMLQLFKSKMSDVSLVLQTMESIIPHCTKQGVEFIKQVIGSIDIALLDNQTNQTSLCSFFKTLLVWMGELDVEMISYLKGLDVVLLKVTKAKYLDKQQVCKM